MATSTLAPEIRTTVEDFVRDLRQLLARAAIDAVRGAETVGGNTRPLAPARQSVAPRRAEPTRVVRAPRGAASGPKAKQKVYTFDDYERAAIQRALGEADDDRIAAAKSIGMSKSAIYRRIKVLGIKSSQQPTPDDIGRDLPLDLGAYESRAVEGALEAASGNKLIAAKLIGSAKSTFYRATARHGL